MSNDDRTEDALRRALSAEAGEVSPGGDGLMKIQQRVAARDARLRWMRPALAGGVAVVVIAAGVGGYAIAKNNSNGNAKVRVENSNTPTPPAVVDDAYPADAIFPFTAASQEKSWEQEFAQGSMPFASDPTAVTESWIAHYLLEHGKFAFNAQTAGGSSEVTVSRKVGGTEHPVTIVHLVKYHNAWLVTGASDPADALTFTSPTQGAAVTSPVTVTGPGYGVDEQALVQVRSATTPDLFGSASTGSFGSGTPQWSASVSFAATSDTGVVVASVDSQADGGLGQLAAEKVTFGSASHVSATGSSSFFAVQGGRLARFNAATGAKEADIDSASNEGTVFEVRQFGDTVYFTAKASDCLDLYSMPTSGGSPTKVTTADPDYGIVGFDLSQDGKKLTYAESSGCNQSRAGIGKLVFTDLGNGTTRKIDFPSEPPAIIGDPVWESDGTHVDAFVRTGMEGYLARYDSSSGSDPQPNTSSCPGFNINAGLPNAVATGPNGALWVASQTGTSMQVVSCTGDKPTTEFTVPGNNTPQSLSVNASGEVLLVGDSGKVWKWTGSGDATMLPEATGVTSITW
jgi:hypothetical protein